MHKKNDYFIGKKNIFILFSVIILFLSSFYYFYIYGPNSNNDIKLTSIEKDYLENLEEIVYAADQNAPPLRFVDKSDGQYKGVVIDYISQLSLELGVNIQTKPLLWEEALESLKSGDTQICDMFPSDERSQHFIFTKPIYNLRAAVAVNRNNNENLNSLFSKNIKLATQKGDYLNYYMINNYPNVELVYTSDIESAFRLLEEGTVDAIAGDEPVILYFQNISKNPDIKILDETLYEKEVVFALEKSETVLQSILNKGIDSINSKHQLEKIQQKWFGISAPITRYDKNVSVIKYAIFGIIPFLILSISVLIINRSLKKQVIEYAEKQKFHERLSLQANKMAVIGELASGIAHEIRNPLGIIRTQSFILRGKQDISNEGIVSLEYIENAVERASKIIDNLLNFSKISDETNQKTYIKNFLESIISLENEAIIKRKIDIELNCKENLVVSINQEAMKHILINLFSNGIDALSEFDSDGSYINNSVNNPKIIIEAYHNLDELLITFRDNGTGIDNDDIDQIFNPFFTTKGPNKGTGLGLYIVYNQVSKLNGRIWVESEKGKGTKFYVSIPVKYV